MSEFLAHHSLHGEDGVLEYPEFTVWEIKFINYLCTALGKLCWDQTVLLAEKVLAFAFEVLCLLLLQVKHVLILVLFNSIRFNSRKQLFFSVLKYASAHSLQALVEIFQWKNDTDSACESFYLGAAVAEARDELLHSREFVGDV